jgi:tRNA dimethylallyltransferase
LPQVAVGKKIRVPVLLGPTAVGKTGCALDVAKRLDLDIVSCDSRQIYRYMDIGTAKPTAAEQASVKHWMLDIAEPSQQYSAFLYAREASRIVRECAQAGKGVVLCGGSGLYFQAVRSGIGPQIAADPGIRGYYEDMAARLGKEAVWECLKKVDPSAALANHASNLVRTIRALEVFESTGSPLSELKKRAAPPEDLEFLVIVLALPRPELYRRIDARVDAMVAQGLVEEFRSLLDRGYGRESPGLRCVGYRELFGVEEKTADLQSAIALIKQNSRHYAKRQITWLRHQIGDGAVREADMDSPGALAGIEDRVRGFLNGPC